MKKPAIIGLLLAIFGGSLCAQTPGGAYNSPATGGGLSTVTSLPATCTPGVTANVNLTINGTGYGTFYCGGITQAPNTWVPTSAGQGVNPIAYGAIPDKRYESDCTFNSTTTVVCPKGNFTSADVGKIEFGTNALQTHGAGSLIASPVIVPQGTISSVTNSTTVVVSAIANANCTPTSANLCYFAWGTGDDTTALAAAQTAAWVNGPCLPLILPAGALFVSKGGLGALGTGQANACTGATDFNQSGPEVYGAGHGATVLIPLTTFESNIAATCTNGSTNACFGGAGALRAHDFQINGLGQTLNLTTHANSLFEINGVTTFWNANICTGGSAANLRLAGFGLLSTSLNGLTVVGACDADLVNVTVQDFGNTLCNIQPNNPTTNISAVGLVCFGGNSSSLSITGNGGIFSSSGGYYGGCLGASCNNVLFTGAGSATFDSSGDLIFSATVSNNLIQTTGAGPAIVNLWGDTLLEQATSGTSQIYFGNATASNLTASQTIFNATGAGHRIFVTNAGNSITDIGGNTFTNGALANSISGSVFGSYSVIGTVITAAKLVLSAGWGTTAAWTALTGNTQYVTGTLTASGTGQAANPTITYTFPTPFLVAPTGCFALQVGGTQTAVANPFTPSALTNTGVTFTYNGTPGAGNTLFVQIQCWSM